MRKLGAIDRNTTELANLQYKKAELERQVEGLRPDIRRQVKPNPNGVFCEMPKIVQDRESLKYAEQKWERKTGQSAREVALEVLNADEESMKYEFQL